MGDFWNDVKHALHMFIKSPGFTIAAVVGTGAGHRGQHGDLHGGECGAAEAAGRIPTRTGSCRLSPDGAPGQCSRLHRYRSSELCQRQTSIFKDVAAYDFGGPGFNVTGGRPEQVHGIHVTEGYFRVFGAPVMLGRTFTAQEDMPERRQGGGAELRTVAAQVWRQSERDWERTAAGQ